MFGWQDGLFSDLLDVRMIHRLFLHEEVVFSASGRVVIFSNMRLTADNLAHQLKREGMTCRHLHGKLDQDCVSVCVGR